MASMFRRHPRGRPPHADVLTPAEWRVLEEVRAGRSNPEIADRLGISRNTVKTHVSSILSKLEASDRGELALWRGEPAPVRRTFLGGTLGWLGARGGVVVASMAVVVVAAVLVAALRSGAVTDEEQGAGVRPAEVLETTPVATAAGPTLPPCPVASEVCDLAMEYLPLVRAADGQAIAARAAPITFACAEVVLTYGGPATIAQRVPHCAEAPPVSKVDLYIVHNGKGALLNTDIAAFSDLAGQMFESLGTTARLVGVGCGASADGVTPDCSEGAVALYSTAVAPASVATPTPTMVILPGGKPSIDTAGRERPPPLTGLVFVRSEADRWQVQKAWTPYLSGTFVPIEDGLVRDTDDAAGSNTSCCTPTRFSRRLGYG